MYLKQNGIKKVTLGLLLSATLIGSASLPEASAKAASKSAVSEVNTSEAGKCIVNYAKKFLGNPYRSGGTSLTKGTDCSGFTKAIYAHFGFSLPRTSSEQRRAGYKVSWGSKKPGDIICYNGHVAIYMGNNKIIHASNPRSGIKISKYIKFSKVLAVRRILPS